MKPLSDRLPGVVPPTGLLRGASLFLDFDGTVVEIAPRPAAVRITSQLTSLLSLLQERLNGRLAILTGRSSAQVEQLLGSPTIAVAGHHGLEAPGNSGQRTSVRRANVLDSVVVELRQLERDFPGVLVEDKPLAVAVHYRQAPDAEEACRSAVSDIAARAGLEVQPGKMVFELRPPGADKGTALRAIMATPAFAGTTPVFIGDDLTDEPAFQAARALGGAGIIVGDRVPTSANFRVSSVAEALKWLRQAAEIA